MRDHSDDWLKEESDESIRISQLEDRVTELELLVEKLLKREDEPDVPTGQDPDGTIDLGLAPLEEEWHRMWCNFCNDSTEADDHNNCFVCGKECEELF